MWRKRGYRPVGAHDEIYGGHRRTQPRGQRALVTWCTDMNGSRDRPRDENINPGIRNAKRWQFSLLLTRTAKTRICDLFWQFSPPIIATMSVFKVTSNSLRWSSTNFRRDSAFCEDETQIIPKFSQFSGSWKCSSTVIYQLPFIKSDTKSFTRSLAARIFLQQL